MGLAGGSFQNCTETLLHYCNTTVFVKHAKRFFCFWFHHLAYRAFLVSEVTCGTWFKTLTISQQICFPTVKLSPCNKKMYLPTTASGRCKGIFWAPWIWHQRTEAMPWTRFDEEVSLSVVASKGILGSLSLLKNLAVLCSCSFWM